MILNDDKCTKNNCNLWSVTDSKSAGLPATDTPLGWSDKNLTSKNCLAQLPCWHMLKQCWNMNQSFRKKPSGFLFFIFREKNLKAQPLPAGAHFGWRGGSSCASLAAHLVHAGLDLKHWPRVLGHQAELLRGSLLYYSRGEPPCVEWHSEPWSPWTSCPRCSCRLMLVVSVFFPHISVWGSCFLAPTRHSAAFSAASSASSPPCYIGYTSSHHRIISSHMIITSTTSSSHIHIIHTIHTYQLHHIFISHPHHTYIYISFITSSSHIHIIHTYQPHTSHTCTSSSHIHIIHTYQPHTSHTRLLSAVLRASTARLVAAGPRLLSVWQAQCSEPLERVAARLVAAGPRLLSVRQAQCSEPLEMVAARLVAAGPRLLSVWQAQYSEPLERVTSKAGLALCCV